MKIIIINGQGGAGKDSFVKFCQKHNDYCKIFNYSTIDFVKDVARKCGWDGRKTQRARKFLSDLKDLISEYNDAPYCNVVTRIKNTLYHYNINDKSTENLIFFIHSREPQDIERWVKDFQARTLLIHRFDGKVFQNHADRDVYTIDYDYIIKNDGTLEELEEKAREFIKEIKQDGWQSIDENEIFDMYYEEIE